MSPEKFKLGELEIAVLDYIWHHGEGSVRSVHDSLGSARRVSYNTIQSTLERLYRKSLLSREKVSHAFVYRAALSRSELMSRYISDVIEMFADGHDRNALTAFTDWLERADSDTLQELEALLEAKRPKGDKRR